MTTNLTFGYDRDGRLIRKGGSFAKVNLPNLETATYSDTDQISTWNNIPLQPNTDVDKADNILNDPSTGLSYGWNARNQLTTVSGGITETYDAFGRREVSVSGQTLSLLHDGSGLIAGQAVSGSTTNFWSYLAAPGGGAVAGTFTTTSGASTYVPLVDIDGSTIALANTSQSGAPLTNTYTYDTNGVVTPGGTANSWPFMFHGLEHQVTDPSSLYFEPSGNFYNPKAPGVQLSLLGPQGLGAGGGSAPGFIAGPDGGGGISRSQANQTASAIGTGISGAIYGWNALVAGAEIGGWAIPGPGWVAAAAAAVFDVLNDIFGFFDGGDAPPTPRELKHMRHPVYLEMGIRSDLLPSQGALILASSTLGGDADDFALEGKALDAKIRQLSEELHRLPSGKERSRLKRHIDELRRRRSKRAHGADKGSKLSIVPLIPEAPLAEGGEVGLEVGVAEDVSEAIIFFLEVLAGAAAL